MGSSLGGSLGSILPIAIIGIIIFIVMKKRKESKGKAVGVQSTRRTKDEVWKTIKQYLKNSNEYGKEIIDSYVVKRNHIDYIDPNWSAEEKKNKRAEIRIRKQERHKAQKLAKKNKQPFDDESTARDVYVVIFQTRDTKTLKVDPQRCIECEVVNKKINKKDYDRKILIHGALNFDTEMEWIAPIRAAEKVKFEKAEQKQQQAKAKQDAKLAKKKAKEKLKIQKNAK